MPKLQKFNCQVKVLFFLQLFKLLNGDLIAYSIYILQTKCLVRTSRNSLVSVVCPNFVNPALYRISRFKHFVDAVGMPGKIQSPFEGCQ